MMAFEKRWAQQLLSAFAPAVDPDPVPKQREAPCLSPRAGEVDYVAVLVRMMRESTPQAALGLRAAIWIAALSPLWLWGRLGTVARLAAERRAALLSELLRHRSFFVREMATLLKFCAAMALLGSAAVRERSGYDQLATAERSESGLRRLPVVSAAPALHVWPARDGEATEVELEPMREAEAEGER